MKKFMTIMLVVGLMAVVAQATVTNVNYIVEEVSSGQWEVSVEVTSGDVPTAGLSAYGVFVLDTLGVSYVENTLGAVTLTYAPFGFSSADLVAGYMSPPLDTNFNFGSKQNAGASALLGIGMVAIDALGLPNNVVLGVPALLGTLTTPAGLILEDFAHDNAGLLNAANDGYLGEEDFTVSITPEPMTIGLIGLGGLALIRRRR